MKTKIICSILSISFVCTGCSLLNEEIESNNNESGINAAPPVIIESTKEVELTLGEKQKLYPSDVANDSDGDKLKFSVPEEPAFENDFAKVSITEEYIEFELTEEVSNEIFDTFEVYVTDGEYRASVTIKITGESETKETSESSGIPYAKGNPVKFTLETNELFINVSDLATDSGNLIIKSIKGNDEYTGTYGKVVLFSSSKIKYTVEEYTSGIESFDVIVSNGTNDIPVNIEINIK